MAPASQPPTPQLSPNPPGIRSGRAASQLRPITLTPDFVATAGSLLGMKIEWQGKGVDEVGIDTTNGEPLVKIDTRYFRPTEVDLLLGDSSKARRVLGWKHTVSFADLVSEMVNSDLKAIASESRVRKFGHD